MPPSGKGSFSSQLRDLLTKNGVDAAMLLRRNVDDLARYTSNGRPVVVRIEGADDFSHFVVVDGITTRNGMRVVAIRDPANAGSQYFSPLSTFKNSFTGEVVVPR